MTGRKRVRRLVLPALWLLVSVADAGAAQGSSPSEPVGKVVRVRVPAEIRSGDREWRPLTEGAAIRAGDALRTGAGGSLRVLFHDGTELDLAQESELAVVRYPAPGFRGGASPVEVRLVRGRLEGRASMVWEGEGNEFRVVSPTAAVRVLGAEFALGYDSALDVTRVTGLEGRLAVHSALDPAGRGVFLSARQVTSVRRASPPDPPLEVDRALLEEMDAEAFMRIWPDEVTWRASGVLSATSPESGERLSPVGAGADAPEVRARRGSSVAEGNDVGEILGESPAALGAPGGVDLGIRF